MAMKLNSSIVSDKFGDIYINIDVEDLFKNVDVKKVMRCYALKQHDIIRLENMTSKKSPENINKAKWFKLKDILMDNNRVYCNIGLLVRDLFEDIQMGHHRIPDRVIEEDVKRWDMLNGCFDKANAMKFKFEILCDFCTGQVSTIVIYFDNQLSYDNKIDEVEEIKEYLGFKKQVSKNVYSCQNKNLVL